MPRPARPVGPWPALAVRCAWLGHWPGAPVFGHWSRCVSCGALVAIGRHNGATS